MQPKISLHKLEIFFYFFLCIFTFTPHFAQTTFQKTASFCTFFQKPSTNLSRQISDSSADCRYFTPSYFSELTVSFCGFEKYSSSNFPTLLSGSSNNASNSCCVIFSFCIKSSAQLFKTSKCSSIITFAFL